MRRAALCPWIPTQERAAGMLYGLTEGVLWYARDAGRWHSGRRVQQGPLWRAIWAWSAVILEWSESADPAR